jgi:DNA-directed RNA polymerase specialized sigma24 family protein
VRWKTATDEQLLTSSDPEDFGRFYDRHVDRLLGWFARRTGDPEAAVGLTAETFAAALLARPRYRPRDEAAEDWLHALARAALEGRSAGAAQRLAVIVPPVEPADRLLIAGLARDAAINPVRTLPADPRDAVRARVVDEEGLWR